MLIWKLRICRATCAAVLVWISAPLSAEESAVTEKPAVHAAATKKNEPQVLKLADGQLALPVPGQWKVVKPRSRIILHEFSIPADKGDLAPAG